jgi:enamine deaminase RidA (YjgF/YER057c/UK114 family)
MSFMKNPPACLFLLILIFSCTSKGQDVQDQKKDNDVEQRLQDLGIQLQAPTPPIANYVKAVRTGNLVFLSGHGPTNSEGVLITGKLGSDLTVEQGQEAARITGIALLSSLKAEIQDLNKVRRIVKVTGMVNADSGFIQHPQVINGFSDLMVEVFGDKGKHARAAIGMGSLPGNMAVEIEMVVEVE